MPCANACRHQLAATTSMALSTLPRCEGAAKGEAQIMSSLRKNPLEMVGNYKVVGADY